MSRRLPARLFQACLLALSLLATFPTATCANEATPVGLWRTIDDFFHRRMGTAPGREAP